MDDDGVRIPPRLAWRLRALQVRSLLSERAVKTGFVVGAAGSVVLGMLGIVLGIYSRQGPGGGCLLIIEAPLVGFFCAIGFGWMCNLWQYLVRRIMYAVDARERRAVRTLQQMEAGDWQGDAADDDSPDEPHADAPDGLTTPGTSPDERLTQGRPAEVKREAGEA